MILRCTNILSPLGDELTHHDAIKIGAEYVVLTLYAAPGRDVMLRVMGAKPELRSTEQGPPPLWRSQMFEVLSNEIPSNWRAELSTSGTIRLEPESWLRPGFWEDLTDWTPLSAAARQDYDAELGIILREAKVPI